MRSTRFEARHVGLRKPAPPAACRASLAAEGISVRATGARPVAYRGSPVQREGPAR